jgi:hypothetical protein
MNRRTFLQSLSATLSLAAAQAIRIWDDHCHLYSVPGDTPEQRMAVLVKAADRLGIAGVFVSHVFHTNHHPTPY